MVSRLFPQPNITREPEFHQTSNRAISELSVTSSKIAELEILRDRVLSELKLGKQASGYKG